MFFMKFYLGKIIKVVRGGGSYILVNSCYLQDLFLFIYVEMKFKLGLNIIVIGIEGDEFCYLGIFSLISQEMEWLD